MRTAGEPETMAGMIEEMPDPTAPATHYQIVRVVSRLFAAYLLLWAISDIVALPHQILGIIQVVRDAHRAGTSVSDPRVVFSFRIEMLYLSANAFQIGLWSMGAGWFYRCGPRIQRFFVG